MGQLTKFIYKEVIRQAKLLFRYRTQPIIAQKQLIVIN